MFEEEEDTDAPPFEIQLEMDPENRMWRIMATGSVSTLLFFLLDASDTGIVQKLWEEAKFDRLVKYDLGEIDDRNYDAGTSNWQS